MSTPAIRRINPPTLPTPRGYHQVVDAPQGRIVHIAGQVAHDLEGRTVGTDLRAQTEQVFRNLAATLEAAGATWAHLVKITIFVTRLEDEDLAVLREVRDRHLVPEHVPASSLVQVVRLFRPDLLVEIEAVAVVC